MIENAEEWFWCNVDKANDCWLWMKSTTAGGYGQTFWRGKRGARTHRVAWELTYGPIPEGIHVLHACDNPPCVRPDHLHLGTHAQNMKEASDRKRFRSPRRQWTECPHGHPFDEANTYIDPRGWRRCKTCSLEAARRYKRVHPEEVKATQQRQRAKRKVAG